MDLQSWVEHLQAQGHDIIISLDANKPYNPDIPMQAHPLQYRPGPPNLSKTHDGKLATLVASCSLSDPMAYQHPSRPFPASNNRGSYRIVYILVSSTLKPAVLQSGSLPFYSLVHSNRHAYCLDLDPTILIADPGYKRASASRRYLHLHDPRVVKNTEIHNMTNLNTTALKSR
jgi:hypothetical protein